MSDCLYTFFIRTILKEHEAHFCSKIKNKLRTIPVSAEEQSLKFSIKVVDKLAASATQLAKCILLHAYSGSAAVFSCASTNKNFM